jgi:hypothetical protein
LGLVGKEDVGVKPLLPTALLNSVKRENMFEAVAPAAEPILRLVEEAALLQMGNKAVVKQAVVKLAKGREKLDGAVRVRPGSNWSSCCPT